MARNGRSSRPQNRRILEKRRSSLPRSRRMLNGCRSSLWNRRMLDGCRSSHPGSAECSTGAARAYPGAAACPKSTARATAVRRVRFLLSKWPLENCCLMFVFYRYQLLLSSTVLRACYARVHTSIYLILNFRRRATAACTLHDLTARLGCSKHRNCRQNQPRGRRWLELAARACPGAAAGSKWPLELAPEPQNARKVLLKPGPEPQNAEKCCSSLPRSRKLLEKCCSSLPRCRRMLEK